MASIECPKCDMPTASALGKAFCPQCGWNREAAEKQTRLFLQLLPVLVIVFDAPLIVWIYMGRAEAPILGLLAVVAIIPVILAVLAVRAKVRVGTPSAKSAAVVSQAGAASITAPSDAVAKQYAMLAELQRPRAVRMSSQGKMNIAIISISLLCFAGGLVALVVAHPGAPSVPAAGGTAALPRPLVFVLPIGLVAVIALVMRRSLVQQRWLLAMGEMAMGRVTKQWIARNGFGIRYEFTTATGETLSHMTNDNARQLLPGMNVPIFYDPREPKKQFALCASFYEIVLPGKELRPG